MNLAPGMAYTRAWLARSAVHVPSSWVHQIVMLQCSVCLHCMCPGGSRCRLQLVTPLQRHTSMRSRHDHKARAALTSVCSLVPSPFRTLVMVAAGLSSTCLACVKATKGPM